MARPVEVGDEDEGLDRAVGSRRPVQPGAPVHLIPVQQDTAWRQKKMCPPAIGSDKPLTPIEKNRYRGQDEGLERAVGSREPVQPDTDIYLMAAH